MKIASFHRQRGDIVEFYKGEAPYLTISSADRVYITTLFTFHYDITIKCIQHYTKYINKSRIFVGGIASTLLQSEFEKDTGVSNIIPGQLTDSSLIGYSKEPINIDSLPLDYDILDDVSYIYPAGDNYFIHTTRGCPRGCEFCAVQTLEPEFKTTNNIIEQIKSIDSVYGEKRNLLIMDNNILCSPQLKSIIQDIYNLGFDGKKDFINPNPFNLLMSKIRRRIRYHNNISRQIDSTLKYLNKCYERISRYQKIGEQFKEILFDICNNDAWQKIQEHESILSEITEKYRSKIKMIRYVDFNQGIDARLLTVKNAKILSKIPISPFRLAFDNVDESDIFTSSMNIAINNGISDFSNYILYNWKDKPEDLWTRLHTAIKIYNTPKVKIKAFSFPMKYAPIDEKDRSYIGEFWNKKYIGAVNIILNVTKGVVAREQDFFYEAFGESVDEYFKILTMPDEVIRFRHFFRDNGILKLWHSLYNDLCEREKTKLLELLCEAKKDKKVLSLVYTTKLNRILVLYRMNKSQFDRKEKSAASVMKQIEECDSLRPLSPEQLTFFECEQREEKLFNGTYNPHVQVETLDSRERGQYRHRA